MDCLSELDLNVTNVSCDLNVITLRCDINVKVNVSWMENSWIRQLKQATQHHHATTAVFDCQYIVILTCSVGFKPGVTGQTCNKVRSHQNYLVRFNRTPVFV